MSTKVFKHERRGSTFVDPLLSCCGFLCLSPGLHSLMKEGVGVTREKVQNYQVNDSFIKVAVLSGVYSQSIHEPKRVQILHIK